MTSVRVSVVTRATGQSARGASPGSCDPSRSASSKSRALTTPSGNGPTATTSRASAGTESQPSASHAALTEPAAVTTEAFVHGHGIPLSGRRTRTREGRDPGSTDVPSSSVRERVVAAPSGAASTTSPPMVRSPESATPSPSESSTGRTVNPGRRATPMATSAWVAPTVACTSPVVVRHPDRGATETAHDPARRPEKSAVPAAPVVTGVTVDEPESVTLHPEATPSPASRTPSASASSNTVARSVPEGRDRHGEVGPGSVGGEVHPPAGVADHRRPGRRHDLHVIGAGQGREDGRAVRDGRRRGQPRARRGEQPDLGPGRDGLRGVARAVAVRVREGQD